jgi:hypothetical protein
MPQTVIKVRKTDLVAQFLVLISILDFPSSHLKLKKKKNILHMPNK